LMTSAPRGTQVVGNLYGMNLPHGGYADGTVAPGGAFEPPTGGADYAGPGAGGPSWAFVATVCGTVAAGLAALAGTLALLQKAGVLKT
jgi:hypothetical protein